MDEIVESFGIWRSAITTDKSCSMSVIFRLMTNIWLKSKVLLLTVGWIWLVLERERERETFTESRRQ